VEAVTQSHSSPPFISLEKASRVHELEMKSSRLDKTELELKLISLVGGGRQRPRKVILTVNNLRLFHGNFVVFVSCSMPFCNFPENTAMKHTKSHKYSSEPKNYLFCFRCVIRLPLHDKTLEQRKRSEKIKHQLGSR
jgi:hypothetical protein